MPIDERKEAKAEHEWSEKSQQVASEGQPPVRAERPLEEYSSIVQEAAECQEKHAQEDADKKRDQDREKARDEKAQRNGKM